MAEFISLVAKCFRSQTRKLRNLLRIFVVILFFGVFSLLVATNNVARRSSKMSAEIVEPSTCYSVDCIADAVISALNTTADPCDNFYRFSCGRFQGRIENVTDNGQIAKKRVRSILEREIGGSNFASLEKARRYYASCLSANNEDNSGLGVIKSIVDDLGGFYLLQTDSLPLNWSLDTLVVKFWANYSFRAFLKLAVGLDETNVTKSAITLTPNGLGIGEGTRSFYLANVTSILNDPVLRAYTSKLVRYAKILMKLPENSTATIRQSVVDVVEFERRIANITPLEHFIKEANTGWLETEIPFLNWRKVFSDFFTKPAGIVIGEEETIIVYSERYFRRLSAVVGRMVGDERGRRTLQNYFVFQALNEYASRVDASFRRANLAFRQVLLGDVEVPALWERCIEETENILGIAVGSVYMDNFFSQTTRNEASQVISNVAAVYRDKIELAPWMDDETRREAFDKFSELKLTVGYPDWLLNKTYIDERYAHLEITDDYSSNRLSCYRYRIQRMIINLRETPDKMRVVLPPQANNGYYQPTENQFVILAGMLAPPVYFSSTSGVPTAFNYGALGYLAGHEIGHAFDTTGGNYDKSGNLRLWWTNVTTARFKERTKCLTEQFDQYQFRGYYVRGEQTLDENIADNSGIRAAFDAFRKTHENSEIGKTWQNAVRKRVGDEKAPLLLDADRLFFIAFAQIWCRYETGESVIYQILKDEHAPVRFRVNGAVSNMAEFENAFNCQPNAQMNRAEKCSVFGD